MRILHMNHVRKYYVNYFSGFGLTKEKALFEAYLPKSETTVAGFSYGAQQALEYVYHTKKRVDRLILLSPAFFQTHKESFKRTQIRYFTSDPKAYTTQFIQNIVYPSTKSVKNYTKEGTKKELEALLDYQWDKHKMEEIQQRGTTIEVFLGQEDKIIPIEDTFSFFKNLTTTYVIKDVGHLLY